MSRKDDNFPVESNDCGSLLEAADKITERRNQASLELDCLNTRGIVSLMNREDRKVAEAVAEVRTDLVELIDEIAASMKQGGRLFYVGAGTSGRLGVIDAVECGPTFSTDPDQVVGILAGGEEAFFQAREGLEDERGSGAARLARENLRPVDTVIGVAASGETPYVIGALERAAEEGALTAALVCTRNSKLAESADYRLEVIVGPEVLTGSTRLKAGTAQKMVLNIISTTVMVKLGKVYSNLMVDLKASNSKLKERSLKIFQEISNISSQEAGIYLEKADFNLKQAVVMFERQCSRERARELLESSDGNLRAVID